MRLIKFILVSTVWLAGLPCALAQTNTTDWPPSPYSLPATAEPQSAIYLRDADEALKLHKASTNAAVQKSLDEIRTMKEKLAAAEKSAWEKDPMLLTCDQFIEKTHDWVMQTHHAEMEAAAAYFFPTNPAEAGQRRNLEGELTPIMSLILFKDLSDNTNFAPLQNELYAILEKTYQQNTSPTARPDVYRFWRFDRVIGYHGTNRSPPSYAITNLQAEIAKRYDLLVAQVAKVQREKSISPQAVAGLKYGLLYRTLDGMCQIYLEARTPPELQKLREDLRRKIIELSWLETPPADAH